MEEILEQRRYDELVELGEEGITAELQEVRSATKINRPRYHLGKHGDEIGAATLEELERIARDIQQDPRTRSFTYRNPRFGDQIHWALVSVESGNVLVYNKEEQFIATIFGHEPEDLFKFLEKMRSLWIEVKKHPSGKGYLIIQEWEI
jgi:hypothetical protein